MKKQSLMKIVAFGASAAMMLGNALPAMAASGTGTTGGGEGTGTSTGHLDTTYIEASVPTDGTVEAIFSFYVDPENIFEQGGKLSDATVNSNDDLVYFATATAGTYASTSQALELEVKNYVDAQIVVSATVDEATTIPLVDSADGITAEASDDAALYLTLNVDSEDAVAILSTGATSTATIDAQPTKFEITGAVGSYAATPKSDATGWSKVSITLSGKAQLVNDATGIVAPKVTLAYEISIPEEEAEAPTLSSETISLSAKTVTVTGGTVSSLVLNKADGSTVNLTSSHYTYNSETGVITFTSESMLKNNKGATITINYSDYDGTSTLTIA